MGYAVRDGIDRKRAIDAVRELTASYPGDPSVKKGE